MSYESIAILSAELPDLDFHANSDRTSELRLELLNNGYSIVGVKLNGRQGFLVSTEKYQKLVKLAVRFGQKEIFISDKNRETCKINCLKPRSKVFLGKLLNRTKDVKMVIRDLVITFIEDGKHHTFSTEQ